MLVIELQFPTGRYHATPWGQHVNEGAVEWPPSPWRVLRALVATWHAKATEAVSEDLLVSLVEALSRECPQFTLPPATASHTRHYMPLGQLKDGVERTAKVFDTFVHVGSSAVLTIVWPTTTLAPDQAEALELLLSRMSYFGRAESWVQLVSCRNGVDVKLAPNDNSLVAAPLLAEAALEPDQELVRLLCPQTSTEIASWRMRAFEQHLEQLLESKRRTAHTKGKDPDKAKLSKVDKDTTNAMYPRNLIEALSADTSALHKQGFNEAPGTRWVDYARPRDGLASVARAPTRCRSRSELTVARFAMASQVPPRLTDAIPLASRVRQALMSRSDAATVFSGKDADGKPLLGHLHAHVLPEAYAEHGRVSHITVYAPMGFDDDARRAIEDLRRLWSKTGHTLQLVLLGIGRPDDFAGMNTDAGQCPLLAKARTWVSRTPFIPTRHPKTTRSGIAKLDAAGLHIGSPEHDLRRLIVEGGHPHPTTVEAIPSTTLGGKPTPWLEFKTLRTSGNGARTSNRGFGFRIEFPEPVSGPIAVGYGAHFGLGVFVPANGQ